MEGEGEGEILSRIPFQEVEMDEVHRGAEKDCRIICWDCENNAQG